MPWCETFVAALATWQAVEIWKHSELFASRRQDLELSESWFLRSLGNCGWCLSVWVALPAVALAQLPWRPWDDVGRCLGNVGFLIVHALAVSRLANLGNDVFHDRCRTPHPGVDGSEADLILESQATPEETP